VAQNGPARLEGSESGRPTEQEEKRNVRINGLHPVGKVEHRNSRENSIHPKYQVEMVACVNPLVLVGKFAQI